MCGDFAQVAYNDELEQANLRIISVNYCAVSTFTETGTINQTLYDR